MTKVEQEYPQIIKFSKTTQRLFKEIQRRQYDELQKVLSDVYEEMGLTERMKSNTEQFEVMQGLVGIKVTSTIKADEQGDKPNE